mmetsp:Transcript_1180/g.4418  ORF Transcript_1180/g.4418 Transcript_1180/m.4418 type:complete len:225 (+) Transcript_1180:997-1671(+)
MGRGRRAHRRSRGECVSAEDGREQQRRRPGGGRIRRGILGDARERRRRGRVGTPLGTPLGTRRGPRGPRVGHREGSRQVPAPSRRALQLSLGGGQGGGGCREGRRGLPGLLRRGARQAQGRLEGCEPRPRGEGRDGEGCAASEGCDGGDGASRGCGAHREGQRGASQDGGGARGEDRGSVLQRGRPCARVPAIPVVPQGPAAHGDVDHRDHRSKDRARSLPPGI